jgi:hypothetical protein
MRLPEQPCIAGCLSPNTAGSFVGCKSTATVSSSSSCTALLGTTTDTLIVQQNLTFQKTAGSSAHKKPTAAKKMRL